MNKHKQKYKKVKEKKDWIKWNRIFISGRDGKFCHLGVEIGFQSGR